MSNYVGTTSVIFSISLGSRRVNLVRVDVTNYNHSTGIPFYPQLVGLGVIEFVIGGVHGVFSGASDPALIAYDPTQSACFCYSTPDTPVPDDVNIYANNGPILFLVIGA